MPSNALEVRERAALRCVHGTPGRQSPYRVALPGPTEDAALAAHLARFPRGVRRTAVAAGVERQLAELLDERERRHRGEQGGDPTKLLAVRDELSARMFSLETQLVAMEFEVDCVRALLLETLSDYEEGETDRQLALTVASLVAGATTGIAAGVWDLANSSTDSPAVPNGPIIVGLVGAGATTALGIPVLVRHPRPIVFLHEHNVLMPILAGTDQDFIYPTFIFRLLTLPTADGKPTPRDELVKNWNRILEDAIVEEERETARAIIFGGGGTYDPRLLDVHQEMLQELGGTLDSLARDIDMLGTAITIVLEEKIAEAPVPPSSTEADTRNEPNITGRPH